MNQNLKKYLENTKENMYEPDIGVQVQNFPDGQNGLAHTIMRISRSPSSWIFLGNGSLFNIWQCLAKTILTLAHGAKAKAQKPFGKEEFTLWLGN